MGLKITTITFVASTLLKSADMNSNWASVHSATNFDGIWNTQTNTSVNVTVEDATISSVNVVRIRPANSNPNRGMAISSVTSSLQTNPFYTDSSGQVNVSDAFNDSLGLHYYTAAFYTGTGSGNYSFPQLGVRPITCTQKNSAAKSMVIYVTQNLDGTWAVVTTDSGTSFVVMAPQNFSP